MPRVAGITAKVDEQLKLSASVDKALSKVDELKANVQGKARRASPHAAPAGRPRAPRSLEGAAAVPEDSPAQRARSRVRLLFSRRSRT